MLREIWKKVGLSSYVIEKRLVKNYFYVCFEALVHVRAVAVIFF